MVLACLAWDTSLMRWTASKLRRSNACESLALSIRILAIILLICAIVDHPDLLNLKVLGSHDFLGLAGVSLVLELQELLAFERRIDALLLWDY